MKLNLPAIIYYNYGSDRLVKLIKFNDMTFVCCFTFQNDSYATLSPIESSLTPLHGVSTPEHDFSEFNVQRRSTLILVTKVDLVNTS